MGVSFEIPGGLCLKSNITIICFLKKKKVPFPIYPLSVIRKNKIRNNHNKDNRLISFFSNIFLFLLTDFQESGTRSYNVLFLIKMYYFRLAYLQNRQVLEGWACFPMKKTYFFPM